ncbi:MAG: alpha/beta hydrolase [Rhodobacteraceae bacterium]|nr:alpha/beta hydrolase [Paracoccaceae bacterium]
MKGYRQETFGRDGLALAGWVAEGPGRPAVFQHGLCGDAAQPAEVFPPDAGFRHHVLDCRGHGSSDACDAAAFSLAAFADDLAAWIDAAGLCACPVGGISMGAALALRLAVLRPDLVSALILARPAWATDAAPANMAPNAEAGRMIAAGRGAEDFAQGPTGRRLAAGAPDNLASIAGFFDRAPRDVTAALLTRISADGPGVTAAQLRALRLPTLVLATPDDEVHPIAHAEALAGMIPGARLILLPPKARDRAAYAAAFRAALADFLRELA